MSAASCRRAGDDVVAGLDHSRSGEDQVLTPIFAIAKLGEHLFLPLCLSRYTEDLEEDRRVDELDDPAGRCRARHRSDTPQQFSEPLGRRWAPGRSRRDQAAADDLAQRAASHHRRVSGQLNQPSQP